jgi:hypothetical protein
MLMTGSSWVSAVIQAPELSRLDFTESDVQAAALLTLRRR